MQIRLMSKDSYSKTSALIIFKNSINVKYFNKKSYEYTNFWTKKLDGKEAVYQDTRVFSYTENVISLLVPIQPLKFEY